MTMLMKRQRAGTNSTTAHTLRRLRNGLLGLTFLAAALSFTVFEVVHQTADSAANHTIPSIMAVSAASQALAEADSAAVHSFGSGEVLITGPGGDYQAQTGLAGQNLEQVAELSEAGAQGNPQLLLINSQLTDYRQLIERAHADYAAGSMRLGVVEMIYASQLLHDDVLPELDKLRELQQQTLADQSSSFWMSVWAVLTWLLPALALLVLLGLAMRYLSERFKRTFNRSLLAGMALLILLGVGTAVGTGLADGRLQDARSAVEQLVRDRTPTFMPITAPASTNDVPARLNLQCTTSRNTCGEVSMAASHPAQVTQAGRATEQASAASEGYGLDFVIPALGVLIGVLVLIGLNPRIHEYRSRST